MSAANNINTELFTTTNVITIKTLINFKRRVPNYGVDLLYCLSIVFRIFRLFNVLVLLLCAIVLSSGEQFFDQKSRSYRERCCRISNPVGAS